MVLRRVVVVAVPVAANLRQKLTESGTGSQDGGFEWWRFGDERCYSNMEAITNVMVICWKW